MKRVVLFVAALTALFALTTAYSPGGARNVEYFGQWGSEGEGDGQFRSPIGVALSRYGDRVYVVDSGNHRVQYFNMRGTFLGKWGSEGDGPGQFRKPSGVAVPDERTVYVTDTLNHRVQCFSADGAFRATWGSEGGGDGRFRYPNGVAVGPYYGTVYVVDTVNKRIQYFTPDGSFLGKWTGKGEGRLAYPWGIAVANNGDVYVTDGREGHGVPRVVHFTSTGSFVSTWGAEGTGPGEFHGPAGIAYAAWDWSGLADSVFVADKANNRVQHFSGDDYFEGVWGRPGSGEGEFNYPCSVATTDSGVTDYEWIYVADTGNHRIQYFRIDVPFWEGPIPSGDSCGGCGGVLE